MRLTPKPKRAIEATLHAAPEHLRRGCRVAEGPALEKRYPVYPGSWVRIPPSPPFFSAEMFQGTMLGNCRLYFQDDAERCPSWPKEHDWKSCVPSKAAPWVRIPLSPPPTFYNTRSRFSQNFPAQDDCQYCGVLVRKMLSGSHAPRGNHDKQGVGCAAVSGVPTQSMGTRG